MTKKIVGFEEFKGRIWRQNRIRSDHKMYKIAAVAFGLVVLASARQEDGENARECRVGNVSLPVDIYEAYAGWECYERTYSKRLTVYVCIEKSGDDEYSVPCFKARSEMMSFNLKNEDTVREILNTFRSQELNDEMIKCYLNLVSACQFSPGGWFGSTHRSFLFNTTDKCTLSGQSKFHVALLSISLIVSIPIIIIFSLCSWCTNNMAVSHCRNVIIALIFRTFFTLLIETVVISKKIDSLEEAMDTWAGCEALASFETVTLNLVLAFWLIFTFYLWEHLKNEFMKEPDIKRGIYIVLGLSLVLAIIWMIIMGAGEYGMCWMEKTPVNWVNDSLRIGFIIVQIVLISIAMYHVLTDPAAFDDTHKDPQRRAIVFTFILSPLFLLQFSLKAGRDVDSENAYVYTEYFFDGAQGGIISLSYLFIMGVHKFLTDKIRLRNNKKCHLVLETMGSREVEIGGAPKRVHKPEEDSSKDVIYSSVLSQERFEKTIKLYNRLNVIPQHEYPAIKEDVFRNNPENSSVLSDYYDVESVHTVYEDVDDPGPNSTPKCNHKYYSSKYLVHDTDTSASDDSVKETSKVESAPLERPRKECDRVKAIESWLQTCHCDFQDYVEREIKNKNYRDNEIHRSLSGNLLSTRRTPKSVKVSLRKSSKARRASAPSVLLRVEPATFFSSPPEHDRLPSIYDDLKHTKKFKTRMERGNTRPKIVFHIGTGNRLLQNRRHAKSLEVMKKSEERKVYNIQLNALLSPRYHAKDLEPGDLRNNKFLFSTEELNLEADNCEHKKANMCLDSESTKR